MRYGKAFIGLFTVLLILAALVFGINEYAWDGTVALTAMLSAQGNQEQLRLWQRDKDDFCLFLPACAELSQVRLYPEENVRVTFNGAPLTAGTTCEGLQTDVEYDLCYLSRGKEHHYGLTIHRSANLPALYVDTASGTMDQIHEKKGASEPGQLRLYLADGTLHYSGRLDTIKGRGNSTWEYAKKPYNLTLSTDGDLLGMGAAKKWILLANAGDPTHLRNKLALDLARDAGLSFTPEGQWVELFLNGEYAGLYLLTERNEVHPNRVNIAAEGSFLVEKDWPWRFDDSGERYITTLDNTALQINYSSFTETELLQRIQSAENAILAEDGIDPVTGRHWRELIDVDSWVKKYLVEEILGNVDACTLSQFFYLDGADPEGKIFAGPIWDMDLILRTDSTQWFPEMHRFYGNRPRVYGSGWFAALYRDAEFYGRLTEVYAETFQPLLAELTQRKLEEYRDRIRQAAYLDGIRWNTDGFDLHYDAMETALLERVSFLDTLWTGAEEYVMVTVYTDNSMNRSFAIPAGTCIPRLPDYEDTETTVYQGWYYWDTEIPFDIHQPVWEEIEIQLRYSQREPTQEESPSQETAEPLSMTQLLPAAVFTLMLAVVCALGLFQSLRKHRKEPATI